jgi:diguanylate cyclase (GGDEF)-like protein
MRDAPRRRPRAKQSPPRRPLISAVLRALAVAAVVALASLAGPSGFWACVPGALLLAAPARGLFGSAAAVVVSVGAGAAASAPASLEPPLVGLAVAAASVAILHGMRLRLEREREVLRRSAVRDPLTGLANRRGLDERIAYEIARHTRECRRFVVAAIDLDGFKRLNDRFGHPAGDELLADVARALRTAVREQDTVARLGGDEFCVLAPETERGGGAHLATKLAQAIAQVTTGVEALSGSVGVAVYPDDGRDARTVLAAADAAQIEAKRRARQGVQRRAA